MGRLRLTEKIGYGLGDMASNLYFQFFNLFLFYYYTDVFGLDPAAIGTMYLVANLWDAVNDPIMGAIADRVRTPQGRYRPFLLWFAVPYGVFGYLLFANPDLGEVGKLAFAYVTFIAFKMIYTAINVPYSALMGVMTDNDDDRVALSTFRFLGAFGGGFVVSLLVRPLVTAFGGGDEVTGFQYTMALFGVVSVALFLTTWATTRERIAPDPEAAPVSLLEDFRLLAQNRPWVVMVGAAICTLAAVAIRGAVTVHYFKYYVGSSDAALFTLGDTSTAWHLSFDATTVFLASGSLAFIAGVACTSWVSAAFGKRNGLILLTVLNAVTVLGFYAIPPDAWWTMLGVNLLGSLLAGPTPALVWALYTDVADYGEWKFGRQATGLVFAAAMFAQKLGLTLGGAGSGWMLDAVGFVANAEQTDGALLGIRVMFCIIPGSLSLLNGLILLAYPLTRADTARMQAELAERRSEGSAA
ncbi:MAG: GPH family glycoside/pentoside/hexuronide:cation symporter [Myxococcota bacterium]